MLYNFGICAIRKTMNQNNNASGYILKICEIWDQTITIFAGCLLLGKLPVLDLLLFFTLTNFKG